MAKKKTTKSTQVDIERTAEEYQILSRQIKELDSRLKPLKVELIDFAKENQSKMDGAFQLKFGCGAYVSLRVSDTLEGSKEAKYELLNERDEFAKIDLDEKQVIEASATDNRLRKLLTKLGISVGQKETFAVYAN